MKESIPTVKVIATGISTDEACEIIAKSVEKRCEFECQYDDPFIEKVLGLCDAAYRDQVTKMTIDIIGVLVKNVDLGTNSKID